MKRVCLLLCFSPLCHAALSVSTLWEVISATGSNTNGGCFVSGASGVNYNKQAAPQYSTTSAVTNGTTLIAWTAASADMVGNCAYVQGGSGSITAGWYQIQSASVGVSITVDRSTGLTAGTGVTVHVGGALQTLSQALSLAVSNNLIYASGSETRTTTLTLSVSSTVTLGSLPLTIIGYTSSHGDNGRFTLTTSTASLAMVSITGTLYQFENIFFQQTAGSPTGSGITSANGNAILTMINCRVTGFNIGVMSSTDFASAFKSLLIDNSEIDHNVNNSLSDGIRVSGNAIISNSYIHDNLHNGITSLGSGLATTLVNDIFYNNGGAGIQSDDRGTLAVINCALNANGTDGVLAGSSSGTNGMNAEILNTVAESSTNGLQVSNNMLQGIVNVPAFRNNTTNAANISATLVTGAISLSVDPFVAPASANYSLNSSATGGALLKGTGFPGVLTIGGTGYMSVGPLQPPVAVVTAVTTGFAIIQ